MPGSCLRNTFSSATAKSSGGHLMATAAKPLSCLIRSSAALNVALPAINVVILATVFQCSGLICVSTSSFTWILLISIFIFSASIWAKVVFIPGPHSTTPLFMLILPSVLNVRNTPDTASVGESDVFQKQLIPFALILLFPKSILAPSFQFIDSFNF
ncbi:hypothetical protein SDC9_117302 [bioreactor metagenome]|uniref:Uncharacterized protein n=1 Tax=bioreactor metagenome TaxID=1076179 RepID=A0A645BYW4_9ZZZZ